MLGLDDGNVEFSKRLKVVLTMFSVPDSSTLMQASKDLHELSQHLSFLPSLFYIISNEDTTQIRHTAAIVFRRKIAKVWKSIDCNIQRNIRDAVLLRLTHEDDSLVRHSVMEIIGAISKHEFMLERPWEELMRLIGSSLQSNSLKDKLTGAELLKIVCESSGEYLDAQYNDILTLISEALQCHESTDSSYFCAQAFNSLIPFLGDDQARYVRPLVPQCVQVIKMLLERDCESQASELIELFESLIETEVSFIAPFVKDLVLFVLQIVGDKNLDDDIRSRVLSLLQCIIRMKKKAILKHNLLEPILDVICPILISPIDETSENDELGFIGESAEMQTPLASSLHVIDDMALHFPPEKLFSKLMPFIQSCVTSNEDCHKRGLLLTLACLSEGTSEYIKANHLQSFLETVCHGATNSNPRVRNAAMFTLGQFSEHLQPDVSKYASEIIPIIFGVLHQVEGSKRGSGLTKAYYALENFAENLESEILPYLEQLMQHLLQSLRTSSDVHTKELVVSAIGAVANAAKENLLPYLGEILPLIQQCLSTINQRENEDEGEMSVLHTQALDTLAVLVRNLGKSNLQLAEDSMKLGMNLVSMEDTDPDLRRAAYGLFAAVSSIVGESMEPFMSVIVKYMIDTIQSNEGIIANFNGNGKDGATDFSFLDDSSDADLENGDDDSDSDLVDGFSVENSYMDEKSDALDALGDLAKYSSKSFLPYLDLCFEEVFKLQDFPHPDIRKASIAACGQFRISSYKLQHKPSTNRQSEIFPAFAKVISEDTERLVVMTAIMTSKEIIEACGIDAFANEEKDLQMLMNAVLKVLQQKSACQDDDGDDEDDQQAEYDEMLIEYCGEIFPILAEKLKETFLPYFMGCLPTFISKLKPSCTVSERSFGAGTIAETVEKLGSCCPPELLKSVVPRFIQLTRDAETEVRNNSIYGLGVILQNGGASSINHYPLVLGCLSQALSKEKSRRVIDNLLSAVARMIISNKELVPLEQVLPVLLDNLPLQEDHDEDAVVYGCLTTLLRDPEVGSDTSTVAKILSIFATVVTKEDVAKDVRMSIEEEIRNFCSRDSKVLMQILQTDSLNDDARMIIRRISAS